jgi:hypothetical protein
MWVWMDRVAVILFDATLSTAVFLTLIILSMVGCRQPVRRILLARVALLASLAILPLVGGGRLPRLDVVDAFVESRFFPRALFLAEPASPASDGQVAGTSTAPVGPSRTVSRWLTDGATAARRWLPRGLTLLDLGCVGASSAWLLLGLAGVQWLIHRSRPPSPATQALFDELASGRSRSAARARLRVCSRLPHPVVTGLLRPTILIPEAMDRPEQDPEPLRLSLLHEIAHAERSDHWFSTAASVAQAVWFFLPHVWWIRSQLLIDQEFLADRSAAEEYGTSSEYASSLLSLAAPDATPVDVSPSGASREAPSQGPAGVQSPLFQRVMMLLHCPYPVESRTPRVWSWASRSAIILGSVAAACLVIRWPHASFAVPAPIVDDGRRTRFQVSHLVAEPIHEAGSSQAGRVYVMPVTLPDRFDLDLEVKCESTSPTPIRVAGKLIAIPGSLDNPRSIHVSAATPHGDGPLSDWHHIHLHRDRNGDTVQIDGVSLSDTSPTDTMSGWLTIEPPPDTRAEFQKLIVTW